VALYLMEAPKDTPGPARPGARRADMAVGVAPLAGGHGGALALLGRF